jgi:hypothetical protein
VNLFLIALPDFEYFFFFFGSWFTRGSQATIITSTTLEVVVPSSLVPIIYGEDGECLKQIRQVHCFFSEFIYSFDLHSNSFID